MKTRPAYPLEDRLARLEREVRALRRAVAGPPPRGVAPKSWSILRIVADVVGVRAADIRGPRRTEAVAWARQCACKFLLEQLRLSPSEVGKLIHRTVGDVRHALRSVRAAYEVGGFRRWQISEISQRLALEL